MGLQQFDTVKLPDYSLCYLVNGDGSGLEDDDIATIDEWLKDLTDEHGYISFHFLDDEGEEAYFCHSPEFGLACNVVDTELWASVTDEV